jgi:tetratricopeptide (TPR) repeat protein
MKTTRIGIALAAVTVLAIAAPATGLQGEAVGAPAMAPPPDKADRAAELRQQAEALFSQPKQWKKAVRLLEKSAALRDAGDPEGYMCLLYAGRIKAALGDAAGARATLQKAAEHALARGALVDAANAYVDAAHAAVEAKEVKLAQEFVEKARLLSDSPLLTVAQRTMIRGRIPA